jgi:hypothetical protein
MAELINTIDVLGDEAVMSSIIDRSITEFRDSTLEKLGNNAFRNCTVLETVDLPNVTTCSSQIFYACSKLKNINFPKLSTITAYMFAGCAVSDVCFPEVTTIESTAFNDARSLKKADFPKLTAIKGTNHFGFYNGKTCLTALILRSETMCTLENTGTFGSTVPMTAIAAGTGYIYVPKALLSDEDETKDYRRATNWSTFGTQFRALEDYTVDGTITGELDETKI